MSILLLRYSCKDYLLDLTGVVPATDFLKDSGIPMTSRGEVIVDEVGGD